MKIEITDKSERMEFIGEYLMNCHSNIYTAKMISTLKATIYKYVGKIPPEQEMKLLYRSIYDYWVYGNSCDEEFYYRFPEKTHEEKNEYMTFRLREKYCKHLNPGDASVFVDKYKTYLKFKDYYLRDVIEITGEEDYREFLQFVQEHKSFVVKPKDLAFGLGIYVVREKDYTDYKELFKSILESGKRNKRDVIWAKTDSIVLEEIIEQDDRMAMIHPDSVNGVRITTVKDNNKITILNPWLKIGANHQFVTSAVCGTMDAGINEHTGIVETNGYKENGENYEFHPDTHIRIPGFKIPRWDELVSTAKEIAMMLPDINYVGWDFALTPKGWSIIEANYDGDFMWQLYYERGMKREFEELIHWKLEGFWWQ